MIVIFDEKNNRTCENGEEVKFSNGVCYLDKKPIAAIMDVCYIIEYEAVTLKILNMYNPND